MKPETNSTSADDERVTVSLSDLFDFYTSSRRGQITSGLEALGHAERVISPETVFKFIRCNVGDSEKSKCSYVTLTPMSASSGEDDTRTQKITLPVDSPLEVVLLPLDPDTGETDQLTYKTVTDLASCFPPFARVASLRDQSCSTVRPGDLLKLQRLVRTDAGDKFIECRRVDDTRLLQLPFDTVGDFSAVFDSTIVYTIADLMSGDTIPARRRRVLPAATQHDDEAARLTGVGGPLQPGVSLVAEPPCSVEARPVGDSTTAIRLLDTDRTVRVAPVKPEVTTGQSLASLVEQFHTMFPMAVRVVDWKEETTIMENHFVRPEVELVLHGTARVQKVLAMSSGRYYSLPITYRGLFQRRPKMFSGAVQLLEATSRSSGSSSELVVRVVYISLQEKLPVELGDWIRVDVRATKTTSSDVANHVTCERLRSNNSSWRSKGRDFVKIPVSCTASFEEVLNVNGGEPGNMNIGELVELMTSTGREARVELVEPSADRCRSSQHDLQLHTDITLTSVFYDVSVYASLENPNNPVFHLPLRTPIHVTITGQLDRRASPLLDSARRASSTTKVSTLDRCVELLSSETASVLRSTVIGVTFLQRGEETSCRIDTNVNTIDTHHRKEDPSPTIVQKTKLVQTSAKSTRGNLLMHQSQSMHQEPSHVNTRGLGPGSTRPKSAVTFAKQTSFGIERAATDTPPFATTSTKAGNVRLIIPNDGNLYQLSTGKFIELLECLSLDSQVVESCRKRRMDGKQFSCLSHQELEMSGLVNPVLLYFRKLTMKQSKSYTAGVQ